VYITNPNILQIKIKKFYVLNTVSMKVSETKRMEFKERKDFLVSGCAWTAIADKTIMETIILIFVADFISKKLVQ
jgi:hypothetical protein